MTIRIIVTLWMIGTLDSISANPSVTTELLTINGRYSTSYKGRQYNIFEGIPYAQPPVGKNRFQPPLQIIEQSHQVVNATKESNPCIQYDGFTHQIIGQEDCLYLNIYKPVQESKNLSSLPTIIWFHGGLFQYGAGTQTKAKYLMDRDVIFVTLNYRLGPFGFLSTEDNIVSGNMGLKDQNLAMRWVFNNIKYFGGDPEKISLFGHSAGGSSVHYHYLSKGSAGLFKNGVSFSGTALSSWAFDPKPLETANKLARVLNCTIENSSKMVDCLKNLPAKTVAEGTKEMLREITKLYYYHPLFLPVAEKNTTNYFINGSAEEILRSGDVYDVPWTSGVVSEESSFSVLSFIFNETKLRYMDRNWNEVVPYTLSYEKTLPAYMHKQVARAARQHYVTSKHLNNNTQTIWELINMKTHLTFFTVLEKSTRLHAKVNTSPVYTYYYSYRAAITTAYGFASTNMSFGTCHLDDVYLVLENEIIDPTTTQKDRDMLEAMLDFWMSCNTGKPSLRNVVLPRVDPYESQFEYLNIIGPSNYTLQRNNNLGDKKFWSSLGFNLEE